MADTSQPQRDSGTILAFTGARPGAKGAAGDPTGAANDPAALVERMRAAQAAAQEYLPVGVLDDPSPADTRRAKRMERALLAFEGELPDPFPRQRNPNQPDNNAKSNRAERIVTAGVDFLFGKDLQVQVEAETEDATAQDAGQVATGDSGAQDFLDAFWRANQQMTTLAMHAINGGIYGHAFLKLLPAKADTSPPRVVALDPQTVRVETDPDDATTATAYVIQYRSAVRSRDPRTGRVVERPLDKRQVIERVYDPAAGEGPRDAQGWRVTDQTREVAPSTGATGTSDRGTANGGGSSAMRGGSVANWTTVGQADWPYAWPPIFDNQNLPQPNEYWGRPDLTPDLIQLNEVLNRTQSNVQKILDNHASPLTYGINIGERALDKDPSKILAFAEGAQLFNLEMHSDLASSLHYLEVLRGNMDEQSCVPAVALGRQETLPKGNLSGVALELLFQPLLQKTEKKRRLYGELVERLCACVLEYAGFGQDVAIQLQWPQILPHDPMADWQVAAEKNAMGVSKATILRENGYDPDEELARSQEEKQVGVIQAQQLFGRGQGLPPFPPTSRGVGTPPGTPPTTGQDAGQAALAKLAQAIQQAQDGGDDAGTAA